MQARTTLHTPMRITIIDVLGFLVGACVATWAAVWIGQRSTLAVALVSWPITCLVAHYLACFPIALGYAAWATVREAAQRRRGAPEQ